MVKLHKTKPGTLNIGRALDTDEHIGDRLGTTTVHEEDATIREYIGGQWSNGERMNKSTKRKIKDQADTIRAHSDTPAPHSVSIKQKRGDELKDGTSPEDAHEGNRIRLADLRDIVESDHVKNTISAIIHLPLRTVPRFRAGDSILEL